MICNCGHDRWAHDGRKGRCNRWFDERFNAAGFLVGGTRCECKAFDVSALPRGGERPVFGVHRQGIPEAETAPAWAPIPTESQRDTAFRRSLKKGRIA